MGDIIGDMGAVGTRKGIGGNGGNGGDRRPPPPQRRMKMKMRPKGPTSPMRGSGRC